MRTIDDRAVERLARPIERAQLVEQRAADRLRAEAVWDLRLLDDVASESDPCRAHTRDEDVRGEDGLTVPADWTPASVAAPAVLPG